MDCDDVILLLAKEPDTLTGAEATRLHAHVVGCESCQRLATETAGDLQWRWVARLPEDAFDDADLLVLPVVDPIVFAVGKELASGGMGRITRARDRRLGREVAIKEILDADLRARFEREATITARLQHPAIVPIYEAGTWPNGSAFYTMRLVSGGTLAQAIDKTTTLEQRLALLPHVVAVTEALAYAHSQGIIHRDLKPQNILVGEFGETVVIDWGLAKELGRDIEAFEPSRGTSKSNDLTLMGSIMGTPCFMPPEQAAGEDLDERADVYALGALLYNVLAGQPPYWDKERDTPQKLIDATKREPPTPIAIHAPRAPEDLRAIVERAMARDKSARYATAREMAEELRRFQSGKLIASREYRLRDLFARWVMRHRAVVSVSAVALLALAVVGVIAFVNVTRSRDAEREARVVAEDANGKIDLSVAALLEEQGRSELVAGRRDRALAYLAEAYRSGRTGVPIRHLLAEATRELTLLEHSLETDRDHLYSEVAFRSDGNLVTFSPRPTGRVDVWDGDRIVDSFSTGGEASHAMFSNTGTMAAVIGETELAMVELATGKKLWSAKGDYENVTIVFDPDDKYLAIVSDKPVEVRVAVTGKVLGKLDSKEKETTAAAFSVEGVAITTCSSDGLIALWTVEPLELIGSLRLPRKPTQIAFAGVQVVVTTKEHEAYIWNAAQNEYHVIGGHRDELTALAVTPGGALIATGDRSGGVKLWNSGGELLGESSEPRGAVQFLKFSADSNMIVGGGEDPRTYVWNTSLGVRAVLQAGADQYDAITGVAWGPKSRLATLDDSGMHVHVWRKPKAGLVLHLRGEHAATGGAIVAEFGDKGLEVHDLAKDKRLHTMADVKPPEDKVFPRQFEKPHLMLDRTGTRALAWGSQGAVVYDLAAGIELRRIAALDPERDAGVTTWQMSSDGKRALEIADTRARVFDLDTGAVIFDRTADMIGPQGALSPAGDRIVFATSPMTVWRLPGGESIAQPELDIEMQVTRHPGGRTVYTTVGPNRPVFDPTGVRILVVAIETPLVVDVATGKTVTRLHMPVDVSAGALDDGGHHAATQAKDATTLWDADTGTVLFSVPGTAKGAFALTHDGTRLATGHPDGTVRIWDQQGRLLELIHDHRRAITSLEFTADGSKLVANGADGWMSVADVHLETRTPSEISAIADTASSWQVVGGALVPRKPK